jgi:hypothetical protein
MGRAYSMHGKKINTYRIFVGNPKEKDHQKDLKVGTELDLKETAMGGMGLIHLPQDRDQWRTFVNTIMNLRDPQNVGKLVS